MPVGARYRFDDNNSKYWHGCCHIRSAAIIIGTIQLMCFLYELSNSAAIASKAQMYLNKFKAGQSTNNSSGQIFPFENAPEHSVVENYKSYNGDPLDATFWNDQRNFGGRPAAAVDVTWHALMALSVVLMFYAIRFTRPYLMAPKFIFDAISAGLSTVAAATLFSISVGRSMAFREQVGGPLAATTFVASVNLYFFWISLRCFKYLLEKRAFVDTAIFNDPFISLPTFGVFDLPSFTTASNAASSMYDRPPAYPTVVQQTGNLKPADVKPNDTEEAVPPSYEEAQRLREQQQQQAVGNGPAQV